MNVFMKYFISKASALISRRWLKAVRVIYLKKRSQTDRLNDFQGPTFYIIFHLSFLISKPYLLCQALVPRGLTPYITKVPLPSGF